VRAGACPRCAIIPACLDSIDLTALPAMPTTFDLSGKTALVTGASSGLGARFARVLAANGAQVILASRRVERLKELRAEIESEGGAAHVVAMDVTSLASVQAAVAQAQAEVGPIDVLVNNSGVSNTRKLLDVSEEDYDFIFDTNTRGAFFVAQAVARGMVERARATPPDRDPPQARIINIASMAGLKVLSQIGVYCMSKAAVVQMT
jgi:NAD(P)-dependent dehydrogenase (short-subunit alcohol dehydrogenase family)